MDKTGTQSAFIAAGLSRLVKDIDLVAKPSLRLSITPTDEATLEIGASKLGGLPDLPPGVLWPQRKNLPQSFIAQIRLADTRSYDIGLPQSGMLWFFYDAQQETFGEDPDDRGGWCVLFVGSDTLKLQRTPAPAQLPAGSRFKACKVSFTSEITLSQHPELEIPNFDWSDKEQQQYETLLSTFPSKADHAMMHHRMLGNPDTIQDDMRIQCQLTSHGVTDANDPRAKTLEQGAQDWQLLLQVDSDAQAGMRWADAGMLYYWITQADLQAQHFDNTWLVLQSD
jgi:uncharacterized protein YwqG